MQTAIRQRLKTCLRWLVSASLLGFVLWHVPLEAIGNELAGAEAEWIIAGFVLLVAMRVPAAYRMRLITQRQGMSLSTVELLKISFVTSFFGLFLPGYIAAGAIRWHMLSRDNKGVEALASVAFDRVNDTIVIMSFGCACAVVGSGTSVTPGLLWLLFGVLALLLVAHALLLNSWTTRLTVRFAKKIGERGWPWLHGLITRLIASMQRFNQIPASDRFRLFGLSLLTHSLGTLAYFLFAKALDLELAYTTCGWIRAALHLLFLLPLAIGGIGVREAALVVLLAPLGITSTQAVAFSFLLTLGLLVIAGLGGLLAPSMYLSPKKAP